MGIRSAAAAAQGVIDVANANMEAALRVISVERGHDPRDFTLVTFGGAGGLHATALAAGLSIRRILVPVNPGLLSALGVLLADVVRDFARTVMVASRDADAPELASRYRDLERAAMAAMRREGYTPDRIRLERWMDLRYHGQSFELSVPYSRNFEQEFHRRHESRYGYADPERESEIVTLRVRARALSVKPKIPTDAPSGTDPAAARLFEKKVRFEGRVHRTIVYERSRLRAGNRIEGPALIFEYSASTALPPGFHCEVDAYRNLVIDSRR
jgi:N-methylhydantoinase A